MEEFHEKNIKKTDKVSEERLKDKDLEDVDVQKKNSTSQEDTTQAKEEQNNNDVELQGLKVHYIDVGQADATLLEYA